MSDQLHRLYNSELNFLRRRGAEFSRAYPEVAPNLQFGTEENYDPYVGRLIEAFAYLNARTRQKLEDDFPEIAGSYLELLYPHFERPFPSALITRFELDRGQAEMFNGYVVPSGTILTTPPIDGEPCRFQTRYPVHCWPLDVTNIQLRGLPFEAPQVDLPELSQGMLKVRLKTFASHVNFSAFEIERLRFFIRMPPPFSFQMWEMLLNDVVGVAVGTGATDRAPVSLGRDVISTVGFGADEGMLAYPPQSFVGYRLLSEYFAFPEKFLFFDVNLRDAHRRDASEIELYFFLRKRWPDLERAIQSESLQLNCAPAINTFRKRLEPIYVNHYQPEYPLTVDSNRQRAFEIWSVDRVWGVSQEREQLEFVPFYSFEHADKEARHFWFTSRETTSATDELERGTDLRLSIVDLHFSPFRSPRTTIHAEATVTNRNLPARLAIVAGESALTMESAGVIDRVVCLTKPSSCQRPEMGQSRRWKLVSLLSLNHLSVASDAHGVAMLREMLQLHELEGSPANLGAIAGISAIRAEPAFGRLPGDRSGAVCRGMEMQIELDPAKYTAGDLLLFSAVLESFFSLYCTINSFTRLVVVSKRSRGVLHRWPARAGLQTLI